jgi:sialate O-acetylesterase
MELPMKMVSPIYETEIVNSENPNIRYFAVPQKYNFNTPESDIPLGSWQSVNQNNILNFLAIVCFFSKELTQIMQ